ncbi:Alpha/Beta hydrolase protein [Phellopilus nigrolimitatus]|nr:Alpha/Beta hydrolase protein [Phellopilus nigrolimitatus]
MQTARIDSDGTQLAYIDSGAPQSDTYTTLVCVHGHTFHAQNFSRLLPLAHKHGLRVIALNRRDYVGSTPFSNSDLDVINGKDDRAHRDFLRKRGLEIARFLVWVIKEKKIPHASEDGTSGGLALLGWSQGNVTTLSFLAHLNSYPHEIVAILEPYLRTFFLYDAPNAFLGYSSPEGTYRPSLDPDIPEDKLGLVFAKWVSSYYAHPAYSDTFPGEKLHHRSIGSLQDRLPENPYRASTSDTLTAEELVLITDAAPANRSEQPLSFNVHPSTFHDQARRALLRDNRDLLPRLKTRLVYGLASISGIQRAAWELEKDCTKWRTESGQVRPIEFIPIKGANHFMHWDDADIFLKVLKDAIRS